MTGCNYNSSISIMDCKVDNETIGVETKESDV